jgi:apolipoprotein N-acyltransferase
VTTADPSTRPTAGERPAGAPHAAPARTLPLWVAVVTALAGGVALLFAFPPYGWWWLAPVGVALLAVAVHRRRLRAGAGLGALTGLVFFVPLLGWTNLHTGYAPWLLLAGAEAGFVALAGVAAAWAGPLVDRHRWSWPVLTGLLWVALEAARDRAPFGGFPWGRLAFSQGDSPLLRLAAVGGAPLVTFAVGVVGGVLAVALWTAVGLAASRRAARRGGIAAWRGAFAVLGLAGVAAALIAAALAVPVGHPGGQPVTVAVVQGNVPRLGLDFNAQRRAVLDNHVNATIDLAAQVAAGRRAKPDLVVWPENASDIDPTGNPDAADRIDAAATAIDAPILVGTMLLGPDSDQIRNVGLVWEPGSPAPDQQFYVKRHPVPFAEYIPLRNIARMVSDKVDLVQRDMVGGDAAGVLRVGPATVGDVICFEVAYDDLVRDTVTGGAQLIAVQTNNATFNNAEATQQMAMVRLRAVEHGRPALMASTVGVSGFVGADGTVYDESRFNTQAVLVRQLRLGDGRTVATRLGVWPEVGLAGLAVAALAGATVLRLRGRREAGTGAAGTGAAAGDAGQAKGAAVSGAGSTAVTGGGSA